MSLTSLISGCCLTSEGIELIKQVDPFPHMFSLLLDKKYYYPFSKTFMTDLPNTFGSSFEELIRHHPELQSSILKSLMEKLNTAADLTLEATKICRGPIEDNEFPNLKDEENNEVDMISSLSRAYALLACLEPLLLRKDTVTELVDSGQVQVLIKLLKAGLGTPKFLLTSLVCSIDSTPHSIGDCLIVTIIARCFGHIAEIEPEKIIVIILDALNVGVDEVQELLVNYWTKYGNAAALEGTKDLMYDGGNDGILSNEPFRLHRLLDTISRRPLQEICPLELSPDLTAFSNVLKGIAVVDYLTGSLASIIQPTGGKTLSDPCIAVLSKPQSVTTIKKLVEGIYQGSQKEIARAKGCFSDAKKADVVTTHPVYQLLVIAVDSIQVKESAEDVSKKVCKIERGSIINAYERVFSPTNMLRYRVAEGWVSHFRSPNSTEPQIEVVNVKQKSQDMIDSEVLAAQSATSPDPKKVKRTDFEKFSLIAPRRGGFMSLFHLHTSTR